MSLSKEQRQAIEESIEGFMEKRRPPPDIRDELDLEASIEDQSVLVHEVRPDWQDPSEKMRTPVVKTTYVKSRDCWKIYWMKRDLEWHLFEPEAEVDTLDEVFEIVDENEAYFFG